MPACRIISIQERLPVITLLPESLALAGAGKKRTSDLYRRFPCGAPTQTPPQTSSSRRASPPLRLQHVEHPSFTLIAPDSRPTRNIRRALDLYQCWFFEGYHFTRKILEPGRGATSSRDTSNQLIARVPFHYSSTYRYILQSGAPCCG